jgi:hypothetical protein
MAEPFLALITPLTGAPPTPTHPIAPGGGGGTPSHPIYHPGHPDHGRPSHPIYNPPYPDQGLPSGGSPTHPIAPGGTPVPPQVWPATPPSPLPPELESQIVVAVHRPGQEWEVKAYSVVPSQGQPQPTPVG